jgi:hypothetical protein
MHIFSKIHIANSHMHNNPIGALRSGIFKEDLPLLRALWDTCVDVCMYICNVRVIYVQGLQGGLGLMRVLWVSSVSKCARMIRDVCMHAYVCACLAAASSPVRFTYISAYIHAFIRLFCSDVTCCNITSSTIFTSSTISQVRQFRAGYANIHTYTHVHMHTCILQRYVILQHHKFRERHFCGFGFASDLVRYVLRVDVHVSMCTNMPCTICLYMACMRVRKSTNRSCGDVLIREHMRNDFVSLDRTQILYNLFDICICFESMRLFDVWLGTEIFLCEY